MSSSEIARQSVRASAILLAGSLISNGILLINALLVARLLGTNGYGTYSISLLLPTIFLVASGLGINTALTRFASYHRSRGEIEEAKRKTSNGIRFMIVLGTILTLCCYFSASFVAKNFFQRPMIVPLIQFASLTILGQIIFQSGVSSLVGWSMPKSAGAAYIIQAVVKISLAPLLIVAGLGVLGPLTAQVTGILIAAIFAIVVLQPILRGTKSSNSFRVFYKDIREAIKFGFPSEIGG